MDKIGESRILFFVHGRSFRIIICPRKSGAFETSCAYKYIPMSHEQLAATCTCIVSYEKIHNNGLIREDSNNSPDCMVKCSSSESVLSRMPIWPFRLRVPQMFMNDLPVPDFIRVHVTRVLI